MLPDPRCGVPAYTRFSENYPGEPSLDPECALLRIDEYPSLSQHIRISTSAEPLPIPRLYVYKMFIKRLHFDCSSSIISSSQHHISASNTPIHNVQVHRQQHPLPLPVQCTNPTKAWQGWTDRGCNGHSEKRPRQDPIRPGVSSPHHDAR